MRLFIAYLVCLSVSLTTFAQNINISSGKIERHTLFNSEFVDDRNVDV